jgi:hypothetical protein
MTYISTSTMRAIRGGLLATAALLVVCAVPAQATARDSLQSSWLFLTVTPGHVQTGPARGTLLLCDPPQGHTLAADACAELEAADGDIGTLPPKDVYCPMVYAPVTAHARGEWRGRPVQYTQTFSNGCELAARTGSVFTLDG